MNTQISPEQTFGLAFAAAWNRLERRLDHSLAAIRGISLAEYRLLRALVMPDGTITLRVHVMRVLRAPLDFRAFPFDRQILSLHVVAVGHNSDQVVFVPDLETAVSRLCT